jgi:hypothetical protein
MPCLSCALAAHAHAPWSLRPAGYGAVHGPAGTIVLAEQGSLRVGVRAHRRLGAVPYRRTKPWCANQIGPWAELLPLRLRVPGCRVYWLWPNSQLHHGGVMGTKAAAWSRASAGTIPPLDAPLLPRPWLQACTRLPATLPHLHCDATS